MSIFTPLYIQNNKKKLVYVGNLPCGFDSVCLNNFIILKQGHNFTILEQGHY